MHVSERAQREWQESMRTRCISREHDVYSMRTRCISNLTEDRGWTDRRSGEKGKRDRRGEGRRGEGQRTREKR